MFVPLSDGNPIRFISRAYVTYALIAANVVVFALMQSGLILGGEEPTAVALGFIPAVFFGHAVLPADLSLVPSALTLVTSLFLHADWMHLLGNMLFLWVFADNVEDDIGHTGFAAFYLICGVAATAAHGLAEPASQAPLIGASGAIAGVVAAYLMLHPRVKLWVLLLGRLPLRITAAWVIIGWVVYQLVSVWLAADENVAWWAHIGGFAAGAILIPLFKRSEVPLLDRGLGTPLG